MRSLIFVLFIFSATKAGAQDPEALQQITSEGKALYQTEMASWYGTDLFLERFSAKRAQIGGYFSYPDGDRTQCVFFDKSSEPQILATIAFDSTFSVKTAEVDTMRKNFSANERDLYTIRLEAMEILNDTFFLAYNNTNFNLIPIIRNNEKKVYVLTAPSVNGIVVFGNDYLITFDENNRITGKKMLHRNIIAIEYAAENEVAAMHSHTAETGDYITATDICTLMLYGRFAGWDQHMIIGPNYTSIWNCTSNTMVVIPSGSFDKIIREEEKKNRKQKKHDRD